MPSISLRELFTLAKQAVASWSDDYAPSMGAALAYYTVFSVAPLLLIVISVAGLAFGEEAARGEIFGQLSGLMGAQGAAAIQGLLEAVNKPKEGIVATVVGILLLMLGASTVFGELQNAMDRIWRAPARNQRGGVPVAVAAVVGGVDPAAVTAPPADTSSPAARPRVRGP